MPHRKGSDWPCRVHDSHAAVNRRELFKELVQGLADFEVVEQRVDLTREAPGAHGAGTIDTPAVTKSESSANAVSMEACAMTPKLTSSTTDAPEGSDARQRL